MAIESRFNAPGSAQCVRYDYGPDAIPGFKDYLAKGFRADWRVLSPLLIVLIKDNDVPGGRASVAYHADGAPLPAEMYELACSHMTSAPPKC